MWENIEYSSCARFSRKYFSCSSKPFLTFLASSINFFPSSFFVLGLGNDIDFFIVIYTIQHLSTSRLLPQGEFFGEGTEGDLIAFDIDRERDGSSGFCVSGLVFGIE